jgi:SAM-dependent methyltransferase
MDEYLEINRANWDERAPAHAASSFYGHEQFASDPTALSDVVRFDQPLLGDITGLTGVHLQCHIGTDTISLARLGARMTGLDFSPASLKEARNLAQQSGTSVEFVESNVYHATDVLEPGSFDLVYTGIGALCWLPDIARWAKTVSALLKPGGRLFIREGHPMLLAVDEKHSDRIVIDYPYFETMEPMIFDEGGTYVDTDVEFTNNLTHEWNHGIGQIITAVMDAGMEIIGFAEHDSVPWDALPGKMTRDRFAEWRLTEKPERLAASYTLQARLR